jgi:peroxiredoxin
VSAYEGDTERARRLVEREKLRFTIAHDPAGEIQQRYQVVGVPTTFVV